MTVTVTPRRAGDWDRIGEFGRAGTGLRWGVCFVVMAGLFSGAAWFAIHWMPESEPPPAPPPAAVMIDMTPLPAAPPAPPTEIPPGPQQTLAAPPPEPAVQPTPPAPVPPPIPVPEAQPLPPTPPAPAPDVAIPLPPPPPPHPLVEHRPRTVVHRPPTPHPDRKPPAQATTAPPQLEAPPAPAPASAAPRPTVQAPPSNALPTWQGRLLGRLEQFKRYPSTAQYRHQEGVAYLRFSMDRAGKVLSARIEKSSGFDALDQETLALIHRAEPLPAPPPEVPGNSIELVVPVQFFLK